MTFSTSRLTNSWRRSGADVRSVHGHQLRKCAQVGFHDARERWPACCWERHIQQAGVNPPIEDRDAIASRSLHRTVDQRKRGNN